LSNPKPPISTSTTAGESTNNSAHSPIQESPIEPPPEKTESKYARLAVHLRNLPEAQDSITLTFSEIEGILELPLPSSAREYREWWANDSIGHTQSKQRLDADWRQSALSMTDERVTFSRMMERERSYINFFSALRDDLRKREGFQQAMPILRGTNWCTVIEQRDQSKRVVASYAYSFAHKGRFRVELYITGVNLPDRARQIFEGIKLHQIEVEQGIKEKLFWETLEENDRTAKRIAIYHEGSIQDTDEELAKLRKWAVVNMAQLRDATLSHLETAVKVLPK
jgi:Domain of unknown function (DUF4268)